MWSLIVCARHPVSRFLAATAVFCLVELRLLLLRRQTGVAPSQVLLCGPTRAPVAMMSFSYWTVSPPSRPRLLLLMSTEVTLVFMRYLMPAKSKTDVAAVMR